MAPPCSRLVLTRARLLEDFSSRGGQVVFGSRSPSDVEALSAQHDLLVVASGRGSLANLFPRMTEHSPYSEPQRVVIAGLFRGIGYREPRALEVFARAATVKFSRFRSSHSNLD
jgi:hypothetical protein